MNEELTPYIRQYDYALVCLGDSQDLQVGYSLSAEAFDDFDQFQLQTVHLQPQILKGDEEVSGAVCEGSYAFDFE